MSDPILRADQRSNVTCDKLTGRWSAPGAAAQAGDSKRKELEHRLTRVIGAKAQEQHTDVFSFAADYCANL